MKYFITLSILVGISFRLHAQSLGGQPTLSQQRSSETLDAQRRRETDTDNALWTNYHAKHPNPMYYNITIRLPAMEYDKKVIDSVVMGIQPLVRTAAANYFDDAFLTIKVNRKKLVDTIYVFQPIR